MKAFIIIWAFVIGAIVPLQAVINARLSASAGGPTQAALISFTGGFLIFAIIGILNFSNLPSIGKIVSMPPYLLSGGIIGSAFVLSAIVIVPKLGATGWTALIVAGQLISSIFFDHFGLFGLQQKAASLWRIAGAVGLVVCTYLITGL